MILTDREIAAALQAQQIFIHPSPPIEAYSSTSVDLTLRGKFTTWKSGKGITVQPGKSSFKFNNLKPLQETISANSFELKPQSFVLAWTEEEIKIPNTSRLAARVEGKSTMARVGVGVHITAPTIHCGFEGPIQLEMYKFGPHDIILDAGMLICQLIFEQTYGTPQKGYSGIFQNQIPS